MNRSEVEAGKVVLVRAGDGTLHPIEKTYLKPEVQSLMNVSRPVIRREDLDRVLLYVSALMDQLKGTLVIKYLQYGEANAFASAKSKAVPVSQRSACAARDPWYDLTYTKPGVMFWPMAQQYRHIIPGNPDQLICNHNLFDVHPFELDATAVEVLRAVANSTLVANFKTFFGRYAGTEGNLKTAVLDVKLLELPDPRNARPATAQKLTAAFARLCTRDSGGLVQTAFMDCRSSERMKKLAAQPIELPPELKMADRRALNLAVFELLGVADAAEREKWVDKLYFETARHFRQIRIVEVQKQEQHGKTDAREFQTDELAADLWDGLPAADQQPLAAWLAGRAGDGLSLPIPEGEARLPDATDFLEASTVFFVPGAPAKPLFSRSFCPAVPMRN